MLYQIVHPVVMTLDSESIKDAIKTFVKMNDRMNLQNIIITDHINHYKAKLKYFTDNKKNKVGISIYPTVWVKNNGQIVSPLNTWPNKMSIEYNTKEYPSTPIFPIIPRIIPLI